MTTVDAATLELLPDPTVVVDGTGTVRRANRLAERLAAQPLLGRPAAEVLPLIDEADRDWWTCTTPLAADARLLPRVPEVDLRLRTADGRQRPVSVTAARGAGQLVLSLRRGERRARADATRSQLISSVSHELRSPLTSVRGFTKTLLARWERFSDDQKRQMLATIHEDGERVTRLLTELLDVSRIDAGRLYLRRQMVDATPIADRVLDRHRLEDAQRVLISLLPADLPLLYADPAKLEQVLATLVENSVQHGAGRVTISAEVGERAVAFTVADEGSGIPWSARGQAFTKSFRAGGAGGAGPGLRLYIAKGIVDAHGGRIWGHGDDADTARISFELPLGGLELAGVPAEVRVDAGATGGGGTLPG